MVKIGAELPKLSQNRTGYPFLDHPEDRWSLSRVLLITAQR